MTRATVSVGVHETPPEIFAALRKVFEPVERDGRAWVTLQTEDGVTVTFFATPTTPDAKP